MTDENQEKEEQGQSTFGIQRIYVKDMSFESPLSPDSLNYEQWAPEMNFQISSRSNKLDDAVFEVVLGATLSATVGSKVVYVAEVEQAGIFNINNVADDKLLNMLGSYCPGLLFPYAREVITYMVNHGGFPQHYLVPVNFEQLHQEALQQKITAAAKKDS